MPDRDDYDSDDGPRHATMLPRGPVDRRRPLGIALAVVSLVAAIGAVAIGFGDTTGADSPAAAVDRMLAALADRDVIGVIEALAPEERDVLGPELVNLTAELERLGLVGPVDLHDVDGVAVAVDSPRYEVHQLDDATAAVELVAGRLTVSGSLDTPLTATADGALQSAFAVDIATSATRDFAQDPWRVITVRRDGRWQVSLGATLLDVVLREHPGRSPSQAVDRVEPQGAGSPDEAVRTLVRGWAEGSLSTSLGVLDPVEGAQAYAWATQLLERAPPTEATVDQLELAVDGDGDHRTVHVDVLVATIPTPIDVQVFRYDGECVRIERRFSPEQQPWVELVTCDGDPPPPKLDDALSSSRSERGGEDLTTRPRDFTDPTRIDEGVRLGPDPIDRGLRERQALLARRRPRDNPLSALAVFGGGADLPTFAVVERGGRWYVAPTTTLVVSLIDTLRASDPANADLLVARVEEAFRADESERIVHESRDPDNVLYGSATAETSPLVAQCFRTVLTLVGELEMPAAGTACVRQLEADGRLAGQPIPTLLGAADCLMLGPTAPPAADHPVRRFYLTALARRACVADQVASGALPPAALEQVADPAGNPCYAPYLALGPEDSEAQWSTADGAVEACGPVPLELP